MYVDMRMANGQRAVIRRPKPGQRISGYIAGVPHVWDEDGSLNIGRYNGYTRSASLSKEERLGLTLRELWGQDLYWRAYNPREAVWFLAGKWVRRKDQLDYAYAVLAVTPFGVWLGSHQHPVNREELFGLYEFTNGTYCGVVVDHEKARADRGL